MIYYIELRLRNAVVFIGVVTIIAYLKAYFNKKFRAILNLGGRGRFARGFKKLTY